MARPRKDDKRARILQAAVKVFARKGYFAAQVSEIAKKAGVADGTIYLYFRNKEDLLVCLFEEVMAAHLEAAQREMQAGPGARRPPASAWPSTTCAPWGRAATSRSSSRSSCASPPSSWSVSPPPGCRIISSSSTGVIEEGQRAGGLPPGGPEEGGGQGPLRRPRRDGHLVHPLREGLRSRGAWPPRWWTSSSAAWRCRAKSPTPARPSPSRARGEEAGDDSAHPLRHLLRLGRRLREARPPEGEARRGLARHHLRGVPDRGRRGFHGPARAGGRPRRPGGACSPRTGRSGPTPTWARSARPPWTCPSTPPFSRPRCSTS